MTDTKSAKHKVLQAFLEEAAFSGWNNKTLKKSTISAGYSESYASVLFTDGVRSLTEFYFDSVNNEMQKAFEKVDFSKLKIRERIKQAVLIRLKINETHREALRSFIAWSTAPQHARQTTKQLATLTDIIWRAAGDTSTDFNFYTKRLLLAGVYSSTVLFWLNDSSKDYAETEKFLDRRINDVMQIQKAKSAFANFGSTLSEKFGRLRRG